MQDLSHIIDEYITAEPPEPKIICRCEQCEADIHAGDEVIASNDDVLFCDVDCFWRYYGARLVIAGA
ncbi:hypothetical protein Alches_17400 [Alicyclobacillus hesperidum subsp. aegles]|uniref:hypothetical protein n=1 Tax=Alicyclobacillus hesperidum TaxID=89784 RepID=UPI00222A5A20|nr:hypothetical protein [Alicyclobacillus hesperidum]GLG01700.1 hypothetical protein Alches_17400 [Alicyclobacillus hesperidum subsp. aegles]